MNTETHPVVRLLYSLCLSMAIWGYFADKHAPDPLIMLGGLLLGVVLGRLLEPRLGSWLRQSSAPYRLQMTVMVTFTAGNVIVHNLKQPVISALLAAAVITLILGDEPGRLLRRKTRTLAARLKTFSRPVMPALPPGGTG